MNCDAFSFKDVLKAALALSKGKAFQRVAMLLAAPLAMAMATPAQSQTVTDAPVATATASANNADYSLFGHTISDDEMLARVGGHEGSLPFMYKDSSCHVTAGMGISLTLSKALKMDFQTASGGVASKSQIRRAFNKVNALSCGRRASFYKKASSLRLSEATIRKSALVHLAGARDAFCKLMTDCRAMPVEALAAGTDMAFNLGEGGIAKYKQLRTALRNNDYASAANECGRRGINKARNLATAASFRTAAVVYASMRPIEQPAVQMAIIETPPAFIQVLNSPMLAMTGPSRGSF